MDDFELLLALNKFHVNEIAEKVIKQLQQLGKEFCLSGDDSGLTNVWEELCDQMQAEDSLYWEIYENTIQDYIVDEYEKQPDAIKYLISYIGSINNNEFHSDADPTDEDAIEEIRQRVFERALNYQIVDTEDDEDEEEIEDEED